MSFSVDGLVSGLDTSSMVQQLMQIEKQPQAALQAQRTKVQGKVTAYQDVNSKMAAVRDAADALSTAAQWSVTKASTSNAAIATATTVQGAAPGTVSFTVDQ